MERRLGLGVQKIDPYGRLLANGEMFNDTLLKEGYAQVVTLPPNLKYVDRFLEAQRKARGEQRSVGLSAGELCQHVGTLCWWNLGLENGGWMGMLALHTQRLGRWPVWLA
jgi:hypothetical protein